ncbi:putative porin [Gilvimarinus agarilyticus]|uniref:putative porin n=1 Tax=Gilvimarinus agarilyticus TaxID=679259 RepID=UPI00059F80EE|nr:putative porin [Gilvimarinus agarilyticus]
MKRVFYGALLSAVSLSAMADPYSYQTEIGGRYSYIDGGYFDGDDSYGVFGTYYFSSVQLRNHVYGEAAFLERASSITLNTRFSDNSRSDDRNCIGTCSAVLTNESSQHYSLTSEGYVLDSIVYASATYNYWSGDAEYSNGHEASYSDSSWSGKLGVAPLAGWLLTTGFSDSSALFEDEWNVQSKYVGELAGGRAYNLEAGYTDWHDGGSTWTASGDFYFTRGFSVGGSVGENDVYSLRARNFFTPDVSLSLVMGSYEETDSYSVELIGRF